MTYQLFNLHRTMGCLFEEGRKQAESPSNGRSGGYNGQYLVPRTDAWESEEEFLVEMALPGINPDAVDITFEQDNLTISGKFGSPERKEKPVLRELATGAFRRRFTLNVPVEVDKIAATFDNGLLRLNIPKSESSKPRKIAITSA